MRPPLSSSQGDMQGGFYSRCGRWPCTSSWKKRGKPSTPAQMSEDIRSRRKPPGFTREGEKHMNGWIILIGIPVLGLCVFMHELGHFLAAKWTGIHVEEFGLGFPPRLLQLSCHVQPSQRQPAQ